MDEKAQKQIGAVSNGILNELTPHLQDVSWERDALEAAVGHVMDALDIGFGKVAGPLRAALAGRTQTPSILDMLYVLGRGESLARIQDLIQLGTHMGDDT
jgi:glutamyl-tRNA synthetase